MTINERYSKCKRVRRASLYFHRTLLSGAPQNIEAEEHHREIDCFAMEIYRSSSLSDKTVDPSVIVDKEGTESVSGLQKDVQSEKGRENIVRAEPSPQIDMAGEISMEASISADDVLRAGGFGARDDIGSFLPVASDSTDFEATILNARDYEEPQVEISRPGLGWKEATKAE